MAQCSIEGCLTPAKARGWCMKHWFRWRHHGDPTVVLKRGPARGICSIEGCNRPHTSLGYCSLHYGRLRAHGDPTIVTVREKGTGSIHAGYLRIYKPEHPLASRRGFVYEHRVVLIDAIGPGSHQCWGCGRTVSWDKSYPKHDDGLVVDHIDHNRLNNDPANLRPSCGPCNSGH